MAIQTTRLESKVTELEEKADEYEKRANIETKVEQAQQNIDALNLWLKKLNREIGDLETQSGVLHEVFGEQLPSEVVTARERAYDIASTSQDDIVDIIDDSSQDLMVYTEEVQEVHESVGDTRRFVNDQIKTVQEQKLDEADTARSIQRIVGEDRDAVDTIDQYESFVRSALSPRDSVSRLKSRWQGIENAFENLDTDWETFQKNHRLKDKTIDDLKTLSSEGEVSLAELSSKSVSEMMEVDELRSAIKVSL